MKKYEILDNNGVVVKTVDGMSLFVKDGVLYITDNHAPISGHALAAFAPGQWASVIEKK